MRAAGDAEVQERAYGEIRNLATWRDGLENLSMILMTLNGGETTRRHRHRYEEVYFCLEGEAWVETDSGSFMARGRDTVAVPAGCAHRVVNATDAPCVFVIALSPHRTAENVRYLE